MHLKRWISGLILAPVLILVLLFAPPWLYLLFFIALISMGLKEYYALAFPAISPREKWAGILLGWLIPLSLYSPDPRCFLSALAFILLFILIRALFQGEEFPRSVDRASRHVLGYLYIPFLVSHFILLLRLESGRLVALFILVSVYFGDTLAFYAGRAWGKKKLAPRLSPGKTVEGGWGAVAGSIAGALLSKFLFLHELAWFHAIPLGAAVGVAGQLGDLWESLLKRSAKAKDSGDLIPGHGGVLDRIDSVLFAAPLVCYYAFAAGMK